MPTTFNNKSADDAKIYMTFENTCLYVPMMLHSICPYSIIKLLLTNQTYSLYFQVLNY